MSKKVIGRGFIFAQSNENLGTKEERLKGNTITWRLQLNWRSASESVFLFFILISIENLYRHGTSL